MRLVAPEWISIGSGKGVASPSAYFQQPSHAFGKGGWILARHLVRGAQAHPCGLPAARPADAGVTRCAGLPSQSTLSRFFQAFGGVAASATCFRVLWNWTMKRLPRRRDGYTLDLDSVKLLHEDGNQEEIKSRFTRQGIKPCLHPLLGILSEVRMVASFCLRAGNASRPTMRFPLFMT